jgi:hypothetical protein
MSGFEPEHCRCGSEACAALHWVLENGITDRDTLRFLCQRRQEENERLHRQQLISQQRKLSSLLGGALIASFPIEPLKHIASYLGAPSQALFAVAIGNFDMASFSVMSAAATRNSGHKETPTGLFETKIPPLASLTFQLNLSST